MQVSGDDWRFRDGHLLMAGLPFDRREARAAGVRPEDLPALVAHGLVRQLLRGIYVDARAEDDLGLRAACLAKRLPPGAVASRGTAAWLWGVDARAPDERLAPVTVECTVPVGIQPLRRPGIRSYVARLDDDVCEAAGVPVTTPLRTASDLLRWRPPHMGLAASDALAARGLITVEGLVAHVESFAAAAGVRQARRLAGLVDPDAESFGESWLRLRILDAGFPRPTTQIWVRDPRGHGVYRLDLGWEDLLVAVEYDGEQFHSAPWQRTRDERRRLDLEKTYGWRLLVAGRGEVLGRSLALERAVGELLSCEPGIRQRRW